ncbi:MAG TPA: alpha/beta family hydrolase [Burkholderiales bacterium]|nr:alpha/beta family hydrolase [Burkholderiales bacterium]
MPFRNAQWLVAVGAEQTTAVFEPAAERGAEAVFVCAHGAGGHRDYRGMVRLSEVLRAQGLGVVRFNFLYREKASRRPDTMQRLKECFDAVVSRTRTELSPHALIIGGRSMGGRVASMLAADGFACDALLLLAYPLHPADKPEQLRDAHLPQIKVPVLCFNGTRDALCRRDLMERALSSVRAPWEMHWLEAADHSFHVLKSSGRTDDQVLAEVGDVSQRWLSQF